MTESAMLGLAAVPALGVTSQWLAWRMRIPSILILLVVGMVAGPGLGLLRPDALMGDLLFPLVSLSVALILFEGGMSLHFRELREIGRVVWNLITVAPLVAWVLSTASAHYIAGMPKGVAALVGAILVVTGPTVIIPLLQTVRIRGKLAPIIRWEGIVNDPTGAVLAVLIFEVLLSQQLAGVGGQGHGAGEMIFQGAATTLGVGVVLGALLARSLVTAIHRRWLPDFLQSPVALAMVLAGFVASNHIQEESGLLTVTVMGIVLINQRKASVRHILEFLENLRVLLISTLFVVLSARLTTADLMAVDLRMVAFLVVLIVVVRPATIFVATARSGLTTAEKLFLSWMAPRGIVAASVASVFAIRLQAAGLEGADRIVPAIFLVIVGTVVLYGFTAGMVAARLGLLEENPQGTLILGAHRLARALGVALQKHGIRVRLIDTNWRQISEARLLGLPVTYGNAFSAKVHHQLNLEGIGKLMALTPNEQVNALACVAFTELFGRGQVYQLPPEKAQTEGYHEEERPLDLHGRYLFGDRSTYQNLDLILTRRGEVKATHLTREFPLSAFRGLYGDDAIPLVLIREEGEVDVFHDDHEPEGPGTLLSLITAKARKAAEEAADQPPSQPPAPPSPQAQVDDRPPDRGDEEFWQEDATGPEASPGESS